MHRVVVVRACLPQAGSSPVLGTKVQIKALKVSAFFVLIRLNVRAYLIPSEVDVFDAVLLSWIKASMLGNRDVVKSLFFK